MKIIYEIEYDVINGSVVFEQNKLSDNYKELKVEFEAEPRWENDGIGNYEYWGQKCHDAGRDYVSLENYGDPTWVWENHNAEENKIINAFVASKEFEKVCDLFCDEYKESCE